MKNQNPNLKVLFSGITKSEIFKRAFQIKKTSNLSFSESLKLVWAVVLKKDICVTMQTEKAKGQITKFSQFNGILSKSYTQAMITATNNPNFVSQGFKWGYIDSLGFLVKNDGSKMYLPIIFDKTIEKYYFNPNSGKNEIIHEGHELYYLVQKEENSNTNIPPVLFITIGIENITNVETYKAA